MSDPITIPPEALEAGKDTAFAWLRSHMEDDVRVQHMTDEELTELVSAACLAMLEAWPGMGVEQRTHAFATNRTSPPIEVLRSAIILPLPQEEKFQPYTCTRCLGATENADDICDDCAKEASDD